MKRFLSLFFIAATTTPQLFAQVRGDGHVRVYIDADVRPLGQQTQTITSIPLSNKYPNPINVVESKLKYVNDKSLAYSVQVGTYFDNRNRFGLQVGVLYYQQQGTIGADSFHVEYKATDFRGNAYRQIISSSNGGITESIKNTNVSIPLLARYNMQVIPRVNFTIDAGIVYNAHMDNEYTTNASFNYEAIYQFANANGVYVTTEYDPAPVPAGNDWLITRDEFFKDNPKGDVNAYFKGLKSSKFNVGLNEKVKKLSSEADYVKKNIGYMAQLGFNINLSRAVLLRVGGYVMSESFTNPGASGRYVMTSKPGEYQPLINNIKDIQTLNYGGSIGITLHLHSYGTYRFHANKNG